MWVCFAKMISLVMLLVGPHPSSPNCKHVLGPLSVP
jgi:hypothetical protein